MAAEFYRDGRAATHGTGPHDRHDEHHGDNGFDLHAISGNLCRCTGYRPIKDAAFALGFPTESDTDRRAALAPRARARATRLNDGEADFVRPASLAAALAVLAEGPDAVLVAGSTDWGVEANLKRPRGRSSSR